jgi:hypothetical protein
METLAASDPMCQGLLPILAKCCSPSAIAGVLAMLLLCIEPIEILGE